MVFGANMYVQAKLPPSIHKLENIYVYSDIVEQSFVYNSQVPIMGFLPINCNFQKNGYWVFNPPMYVRVKEMNIRTITMKISIDIGEVFSIYDDVATCRLNYRRRPFLV